MISLRFTRTIICLTKEFDFAWLLRTLIGVIIYVSLGITDASAQLDSVHWIPAMHGRTEIGEQYIYLSTPELAPFPVSIYNGAGVLLSTVTISNVAPQKYYIGNGEYTSVMIIPDLLSTVLTNRGLKLLAPKKFYCNLRTRSGDHGGSLTAKGRVALGNTFRIGHLHTDGGAHFVGVMATEDNTVVTFSQFRPGVYLQIGNGINEHILANSPISITLNAGQCYVISQYKKNIQTDFTSGLNGLLVNSTKPIAVNCGSWLGSTVNCCGADIGIDQITPFEQCGNEYILMRGDGTSKIEFGIVVAHLNNTAVYINDDPTPTMLNAGQRLLIPDSYYFEGSILVGNIYVRTSEPVFMYQSLGGGQDQNAALNFVPPVDCQIESDINNIPFVSEIGNNDNFEGSIQIMAHVDAWVQLYRNGTLISLPSSTPVRGNNDYVTIRYSGLPDNQISHVRVLSNGPVQVSIARRSGDIGWGGYFSGFEKVIVPNVKITANSNCSDTLFLRKKFINEGVSWFLDGQPINPPNDSVIAVSAPGIYMAIGKHLTFCGDILLDTAYYTVPDNFISFSFTTTLINCDENQANGQIFIQSNSIGSLEYSLDNGAFGINPIFDVTQSGTYVVKVRNNQGCIISRNVNVEQNPVFSYSYTICPDESINVGGQVFDIGNTSGVVRIPRPGTCDSIVQVALNIRPPAKKIIIKHLCEGEILTVGNTTFNQFNPSGILIFENSSYTGCDSIVEVNLQFSPNYSLFISSTTCNPADVGIFVQQLQTIWGCDSIITTNIVFDPSLIPVTTETRFTCNPDLLGVDTLLLTTGECDSLHIVSTLFNAALLPIIEITTIDSLCNGQLGSIETSVIASGVAPFEFSIDEGANWESDGVFQSLNSGNYSVAVRDHNGCTTTANANIVVISPTNPQISGPTKFCKGDSTQIQVANATSFTNITWSNGDTGPMATFIESQIVKVFAVDSFLCPREDSMTIELVPLPILEMIYDSLLCPEQTTPLVINGIPSSLTYSMNGSPINATGNLLDDGTYQITGVDNIGCSTKVTFQIMETLNPVVQILPEKTDICQDETIYLKASANESVAYLWNTGEVTPETVVNIGGVYIVVGTNSLGCIGKDTIVINSVLPPLITLEAKLKPNGYSLRCHDDSDGVITSRVEGGVPAFSYQWSNNSSETSLIGLGVGIYSLTVTDAKGCTYVSNATVTEPALVALQASVINPKCHGDQSGQVEISLTGNDSNYETYVDGLLVGQVPVFLSGLDSGQYHIKVVNNICPDLDTVLYIQQPSKKSFALIDSLVEVKLGDSLKLISITDIPIIDSFRWNNGMDELEPTITPLSTEAYEISITDNNGCTYTDRVFIRVEKPKIYFPNVINSNPDTPVNRFFFPSEGSGAVEKILYMRVFDRSGNQVFENRNFQPNDPSAGWDGLFRGRSVDPGVFTWFAKVRFINEEELIYSGDVTVVKE